MKLDSDLGKVSRSSLRMILGFLVSGACIVLLLRSVDRGRVLEELAIADKKLLIFAIFITVFSYIIRAYRWKFLFSDVSLSFMTSYRALIIGFFMNNVLPARVGELIRSHTLGREIGKSRTSVLATVAAERLADGLTISLFFGIFYYLAGNRIEGARGISYVALLFLGASLATVLMLLIRGFIFRILEGVDRRLEISALSYILTRIKRFIKGLEPLFSRTLLLRVVVFSIVVWSMELYAYHIIASAFGQNLSLGFTALFLAAVNFSSLVPAAPGGIGVIETFASVALTKVGLEHEVALAMVVSQHLIQYFVVGVPGLYYVFFDPKHRKGMASFTTDETTA
ncbi:MAG TPA: lysylphosphatidylglycerol synthase transmembrane domain-containing protein [Oligoflexia bacterium]|nr:lysylphosphatidylglycerol synthase transmembrane domain-containing protein [Oligoflexia bacterium]HMP47404.1 lysylphosphatidylglycerol synthase transmembrane domain-containing protein [Oligoflexia bacterium]